MPYALANAPVHISNVRGMYCTIVGVGPSVLEPAPNSAALTRSKLYK
jgi:hypothetical protein